MSVRPEPSTFFREIARNRRNSWLLVLVVALVLGALGGAIGFATGFGWGGVAVALVIAFFMSIGSYFAGDKLVLLSSGAQEVSQLDTPEAYRQLLNVVTRCAWPAGCRCPGST